MEKSLPIPVLCRLSSLYDYLTNLHKKGVSRISSNELGMVLGQTSHTIRKDISFLGAAGTAGTKYSIDDLLALLTDRLGFNQVKKCCIVGLGRIGSALMEHFSVYDQQEFRLVAGFESNINRLETLHSPIALYPAYRIEEIIRQMRIELAMIAVPPQNAQEVADRCCGGGVTGILNFTPTVVKVDNEAVFIRSIDISGELRVLSALLHTSTTIIQQPFEKE
ncbi:MAG: redox-sensing transcriptional repressor Rex [Chitinispirillaceae bacterium]|nr:redox-sensing transcriptional repressor Rex [Chitinispirillaceae bacterium]